MKKEKIETIDYFNTMTMIMILIFSGCDMQSDNEYLETSILEDYVSEFNRHDNELYTQHISNEESMEFLRQNIPLLEVPDKRLEKTYYFRWWTYRKHIKSTEDGFVITEFLPPVSWSGKHNTINCPAAHHIYEGRWLSDPKYIDDYLNFWLTASGKGLRQYSFWIADAMKKHLSVHPNDSLLNALFPALIQNYQSWESERKDTDRTLFWQFDSQDGMEITASGRILNGGERTFSMDAIRPTINSYMYGDAKALSDMAELLGEPEVSKTYGDKAMWIRKAVQDRLWNDSLKFFTVLPRDFNDTTKPVNVRELIGYIPWYFNLPEDRPDFVPAWQHLKDSTGFYAPFGLTVCEQSHPFFEIRYEGHECQWNGPSWPFATTQTLKALANFINNYQQNLLNRDDYYSLLLQYAVSHEIKMENGKVLPWIDENLNPYTGDWIARTRLTGWDEGSWSDSKGGEERGKDYNHSGFCDLVISDLIGIKPQLGNQIVIQPLVPEDWDWFALQNVPYHGKPLTVVWDKDGSKYRSGKGFKVFYDGLLVAETDEPEYMMIEF